MWIFLVKLKERMTMTNYQEKHIKEETHEEYEGLHTNHFGNQHEDDETLEKVLHDYLLDEVKQAI